MDDVTRYGLVLLVIALAFLVAILSSRVSNSTLDELKLASAQLRIVR